MNKISVGLVVAISVAALSVLSSEGSATPAASPSSRPAVAASVVATAPVSAPAETSGQSRARSWVPPSDISKQPTAAEWNGAQPLPLRRAHATCRAQALREWVRVTCDQAYLGVRVIAGPNDVSIADPPAREQGKPRGVHVIFPVRRGDQRLIELAEMMEFMWKSWTVRERLETVISVSFGEADSAPIITVI